MKTPILPIRRLPLPFLVQHLARIEERQHVHPLQPKGFEKGHQLADTKAFGAGEHVVLVLHVLEGGFAQGETRLFEEDFGAVGPRPIVHVVEAEDGIVVAAALQELVMEILWFSSRGVR